MKMFEIKYTKTEVVLHKGLTRSIYCCEVSMVKAPRGGRRRGCQDKHRGPLHDNVVTSLTSAVQSHTTHLNLH